MSGLPGVLGLEPEEAGARLSAAGYPGAVVVLSGRRREGKPRVIRVKEQAGQVELVVSFFKELEDKA